MRSSGCGGLPVADDLLPLSGAEVLDTDGTNAVGVVTSSTLSPMRGAAPIAFAMVRTAAAEHGTMLVVPAEGGQTRAVVCALDALLERPG